MMPDYTVRLEQVFQGPMDLLLHLVREQEVDIHEIEINRVIDGYLKYLRDMKEIDIEVAGEFMVMAATLMAIKSRSLLPRDEVNLDEELDPRDELIQRLIEYRHFKEAARNLGDRFDERSRMHPHGWREHTPDEPTIDFGELTQWDLLSTFSRLMRETLSHRPMEIRPDDRPLRWYVQSLADHIKVKRELSLRGLIADIASDPKASRAMLIGTFCALLELMKLGVVTAHQGSNADDVLIALRDDVEAQDIDDIVRFTGFDDEEPASDGDAHPDAASATENPSTATNEVDTAAATHSTAAAGPEDDAGD
ncbi:MAG: segregation/condensation protein A [Planctomycetes bacterium]|nr:segregation/condensation protein A [Planctomycetota bacterium]